MVDATINSQLTDDSAKGIVKLTEHAIPISEDDVISPQNMCQDCCNNKQCMTQINTLAKTITNTNEIQ